MIRIGEDRTTIYITRGDATGELNKLAFCLPIYNAETKKDEYYEFKPTDKISFVAFDKKGYTKHEILRKEFTLADLGYRENTIAPELPLTELDTKAFPLKNKGTTYWYDLTLNDTLTILGFDDEGSKKIIVYPEVGEREDR
jgi:hypothetical protein